jgi:hypothetical protein
MERRNEWRFRLRRYLPQETVEIENTTSGANERSQKKKDCVYGAFFLRKQSTGEAPCSKKNRAKTSPENHPQILPLVFASGGRNTPGDGEMLPVVGGFRSLR